MNHNGGGLHLGRIAGIRVSANWSLLVVIWLISWSLATVLLPDVAEGYSSVEYWLAGVVASVTFFACLLAHELAHSVIATHHDIEVEGIDLWLFGGVSRLKSEAQGPEVELKVAAAGPITSLVIAAVFVVLAASVGAMGGPALLVATLGWLGWINAILAVFNLAPAFPLDGGRVLRAWLWHRHGDKARATATAAKAGRVFGFFLIGLGTLQFATANVVGGLWLVFLGWFLLAAAAAEAMSSMLATELAGVTAADVMTASPIVAPASITVAELLERYVYANRCSTFPLVDPSGTVVALITIARVKQISASARTSTRAVDASTPVQEVVAAAPGDALLDLIPRMNTSPDQRALVFDSGRLVGIVSPSDVTRAIERAQLSHDVSAPRPNGITA